MQTLPKRTIIDSGTAKIGNVAYTTQATATDQISGDPEESMGLSVSLETEGNPVEIEIFGGEVGVSLSGAAAWAGGTFRLYRDGVVIKSRIAYAEKANVVGSLGDSKNFKFLDTTVDAGVHTYTLTVQYFGGTTSSQFYTQDYFMTAKEL